MIREIKAVCDFSADEVEVFVCREFVRSRRKVLLVYRI